VVILLLYLTQILRDEHILEFTIEYEFSVLLENISVLNNRTEMVGKKGCSTMQDPPLLMVDCTHPIAPKLPVRKSHIC
jgi:hypothetical protein